MTKRIALLIALLLVGLIAYSHYHHEPVAPKPVAAIKPIQPQRIGTQSVCGSDAPPCITLKTPEQSYGLNDFRLYNRDCISFISLPDHVQRSYCGPFSLQWTGPEST